MVPTKRGAESITITSKAVALVFIWCLRGLDQTERDNPTHNKRIVKFGFFATNSAKMS